MILASIVPFFVLVAYRFSSHLHYSKFIIFSSSTFIIITNPYKKKQTAISNMFYLLFSKKRWDWLWLRIILQGIKTEFVFFFRNFYMKSNYILHVTRISDLQSQTYVIGNSLLDTLFPKNVWKLFSKQILNIFVD